ncbi:MAG: hypothetical protein ACO3A2_08140 [Bdellovibrionia bacterium]
MNSNPFDSVPRTQFFFKLLEPMIVWLVLCWGLTNLIYPHVWPEKKLNFSQLQFDVKGTWKLYQSVANRLLSPPAVCAKAEVELTDSELLLCRQFKAQLNLEILLGVFPWAALGVAWFINWMIFLTAYHHFAECLDRPNNSVLGKVTEVRHVGQPFFARYFFLKAIRADFGKQRSELIYLPRVGLAPDVGQPVLVFQLRFLGGKARYLGLIQYPHLSILRDPGKKS